MIAGVINGKMNMITGMIDSKAATASELNTSIFAKRTPGITHLHLVKSMGDINDGITSMGDSAERAVGDVRAAVWA